MKKRLMCLVLIITMLICCAGVPAYASDADNTLYVTAENNRYWDNDAQLFSLGCYNELYDEVYNAISAKKTELSVSKHNIAIENMADFSEVIYDVVRNNPEFFYAETSFRCEYSEGVIQSVLLQYTTHTSNEATRLFNAKVNYIIAATVHEGMSDEEKALALHDYIANNATYGYADVQEDSFTPYSVLMDNIGVCQGYAFAYNLLLGRVGIETQYVSSRAMEHGWSMIMLDGQWYHVDVLWDDPVFTQAVGEPKMEQVCHDNFLISDAAITATGHYGWDSRLPVCVSTKYENDEYCFYESRDVVKYKNGRYYSYKMVEVNRDEIPHGERYFISDDGKYYVERWYSSKFDGDKVRMTKEDFDAITARKIEMYRPTRMTDGIIHYSSLLELSSSEIYLKTDVDAPNNYSVVIGFYDEGNRLVSLTTAVAEQFDGFVRIKPSNVPSSAVSAKLMCWLNGMASPLSNFVTVR